MHQAGFVSVLQAERGLANVVGGTDRTDGPVAANEVVQVGAIDEVEDDEVELVVLIDVVSADDIGMIELADRDRFAAKTFARSRVVGLLRRQDFEGDLAAHVNLLAEIDRAHAAGAETFEQAILVLDEEATPAAGDEFFCLKVGEHAFADEGVGEFLGGMRFLPGLGPVGLAGLERIFFEKAALEAQLNKAVDRGRSRHCPLPCSATSYSCVREPQRLVHREAAKSMQSTENCAHARASPRALSAFSS